VTPWLTDRFWERAWRAVALAVSLAAICGELTEWSSYVPRSRRAAD
jgi:hypothetical protein